MLADRQAPETRAKAFLRIKKETTEDAEALPDCPRKLRPREICIEETVFQQRSLEGGIDESESHIGKLMDAIKHAPGQEIEPIEIWWTGRRWVVIDGHHRLKAYWRIQRDPKADMTEVRVPVRVFKGSLAQAIARSAEGNSKDKLPMSEEEKSDAAWRMVCMGEMSKPEIAAASSRSEATVARMRRSRREILKRIEQGQIADLTEDQLINLTWDEAQMIERGEGLPEKDEEWIEKQAAAWARALGRHFKDKPKRAPEVFARAIEMYSEGLPKQLIESPMWAEYRMDVEEDEAAEELAGDF